MRKYSFAKNLVVLSLFLFFKASPAADKTFNCTEPFKNDNLNAVFCVSVTNKSGPLPRDISTTIQVLYVICLFPEAALMIEDVDTFQRFPNLVKLQMVMKNDLEISEKFLEPDQRTRLQNELFDLPRLEVLIIFHVEFNSKGHPWVLPESLTEVIISNSVFEYDLHKCSLLQVLELPNNDLPKVPTLSEPPPPLIALDLRGNPLRKLALSDIAGHCDLRILVLDHRANLSYCECLKMLRWIRNKIKEVEEFIFRGSLECSYVDDQDCSKYTLAEAESLRQKCVNQRLWDVILWISSLFAILAFGVLACFFIVYQLRNMRALRNSSEE